MVVAVAEFKDAEEKTVDELAEVTEEVVDLTVVDEDILYFVFM